MNGTLDGKQIKLESIDWNKFLFTMTGDGKLPTYMNDFEAIQDGKVPGSIYMHPEYGLMVIKAAPTTFMYQYGKSDLPIPDGTETSFSQGNYPVGIQTVTTDYTAYGANPEYLFYCEPANEPQKTKWYVDELNNGDIGSTWLTYLSNVEHNGVLYRYYYTEFQTQFGFVDFKVE